MDPPDGPCTPHASVTVRGWCYGHIKARIEEGRKVDEEQAEFCGFVSSGIRSQASDRDAWVPAGPLEYIDKQLEELARLRDIAPGWYALARRMLEEDKS